ncbi:MAG: Hsp70 family protein [Bacillota bacterium]
MSERAVGDSSGGDRSGGPSPQAVAAYLADEFQAREGIDLRRDERAWAQLLQAAQRVITDLDRRPVTNVNLPCITSDAAGPRHLDVTVTRRILAGL